MAAVIRDITVSGEAIMLRVGPPIMPGNDPEAVAVDHGMEITPAALIAIEVPISPQLLDVESAEPAGPTLDIETIRRDIENEFLATQQSERERLFEEARQQGYETGHAEGEAAAKQASQDQSSTLESLIAGVREALGRNISAEEDIIVGIAFEAICKIIGTAMYDLEGVRAVVRQVMQSAIDKELLVIRIAPTDYSLVQEVLLEDERRYQGIKILQDERVTMGGCLVETESGTLDGRLDTQLQVLRDTLLAAKRWHGESVHGESADR